jgi:hypothetical protein
LLIVELAWNVSVEAKGISAIVAEENRVGVVLQFATKWSSLGEHLENTIQNGRNKIE